MKKFICTILALVSMSVATFAVPSLYNEKHEENWTDMTFTQIPIYKVLDSRDGYVVIYAKNVYEVGKTIIPKKWAKGTADSPKKLTIRSIKAGKLKPFMTVIKKGNEFKQVILTVPLSRSDATWGVVESGVQLEGLDKEVLEELPL